MTDHLRDDEETRALVARLRDTAPDDVPDPGEAFWRGFPAGVASAIDGPAAAQRLWWRQSRAWFAVATAAAVVMLAVWLPREAAPTDAFSSEAPLSTMEETIAADTAQWEFVSDVLDTLEPDAVREVLGPVRSISALETLSAAERDAFARLLEAELAQGSE